MLIITIYLTLFVQLWKREMISYHVVGMKNGVQIFQYQKIFTFFVNHL
jgi:hypothetical protein